jgi:hypothetical protein
MISPIEMAIEKIWNAHGLIEPKRLRHFLCKAIVYTGKVRGRNRFGVVHDTNEAVFSQLKSRVRIYSKGAWPNMNAIPNVITTG